MRTAIVIFLASTTTRLSAQALRAAEGDLPTKQMAGASTDARVTTAWDSAKLASIKEIWRKKKASLYTVSRQQAYGEEIIMLADALRGNLSENELREVAASCTTMPLKGGGYHNTFLQALVVALADCGYRESLVTLLSNRFPERMFIDEDVEYFIVICGGKFKDPISILGEAYCKCRVPEVRYDIAAAVRRAFIGSGIRGKDDADFVENAM
jgi:hypothetical protein